MVTTWRSPSRNTRRVAGLRPIQVRSVGLSTRWGVTSQPPLATAAYSRAIWIGVTCKAPWPMAEVMVSTGVQPSPSTSCFQA